MCSCKLLRGGGHEIERKLFYFIVLATCTAGSGSAYSILLEGHALNIREGKWFCLTRVPAQARRKIPANIFSNHSESLSTLVG